MISAPCGRQPLFQLSEFTAGIEKRVMPAKFGFEGRGLVAGDFQDVDLLAWRDFDPGRFDFDVLRQMYPPPAERLLEEVRGGVGVAAWRG